MKIKEKKLFLCLQHPGIFWIRYWKLLEIESYGWVLEAIGIIGEPWRGSNHCRMCLGMEILENTYWRANIWEQAARTILTYWTAKLVHVSVTMAFWLDFRFQQNVGLNSNKLWHAEKNTVCERESAAQNANFTVCMWSHEAVCVFSPDCTWSHGRRDPGLLVRNPFLDERRVAENAPSELRHTETMESCYPAERMAQKQNPVGQCLPVVQFERRSPGGGHKPGWPYLARLVEALQSGTSMDRSKLAWAFWLQILYKPVCVEDCCKLVDLSW